MDELRQRALASTEGDVVTLGGAGAGSKLIRRAGLVAGLVPQAPDHSIFNGVYYTDEAVLGDSLDELAATYEAAGVRAWTVWVPDQDRATAQLLKSRGHKLDGAPRAMSLWLEDLAEGPPPVDGVEPAQGTWMDAGRLNDLAYGIEDAGFAAALEGAEGSAVEWDFVAAGGELVACVGTVPAAGDDVLVSGVATLPEWRGRGLAGRLLRGALARRREQGARSASLRASALGAGVYERLGFVDHGYLELWEHRVTEPD